MRPPGFSAFHEFSGIFWHSLRSRSLSLTAYSILSLLQLDQSWLLGHGLLFKDMQWIWKVFRPLSFFPCFVTAQLPSKIDEGKNDFIHLHTLPHKDKAKQVFRHFCKCKERYLIYLSILTLCYETQLSSGASCFHWSSLMFLQLDWSTPVVNSIDCTWFGKAHLSI